jgi:hypothetical protein
MITERQQQQFEAEPDIGFAHGGRACNHTDRLFSNEGEKSANIVSARYRP